MAKDISNFFDELLLLDLLINSHPARTPSYVPTVTITREGSGLEGVLSLVLTLLSSSDDDEDDMVMEVMLMVKIVVCSQRKYDRKNRWRQRGSVVVMHRQGGFRDSRVKHHTPHSGKAAHTKMGEC